MEHPLCRAGHQQAVVVAPANHQVAARQLHHGLPPHKAQQVGGNQGRAGTCAAGQGGAGAALPHLQPQAIGVQHLQKVNVGAGGKHRVAFQDGPQPLPVHLAEVRDGNHRMGVAHPNGGDLQHLTVHK